MDPWINAMTTKKQWKLVTSCTEIVQQQQDMLTQEFHPHDQVRQRPEQQFEGHEKDSYRIDAETERNFFILQSPRVLHLHHLGDDGTLFIMDSAIDLSLVPDVIIYANRKFSDSRVSDGVCTLNALSQQFSLTHSLSSSVVR